MTCICASRDLWFVSVLEHNVLDRVPAGLALLPLLHRAALLPMIPQVILQIKLVREGVHLVPCLRGRVEVAGSDAKGK